MKQPDPATATLQALLLILHQNGGFVKVTMNTIETFRELMERYKDDEVSVGSQRLPDGVILVSLLGKEQINAWYGERNEITSKTDSSKGTS